MREFDAVILLFFDQHMEALPLYWVFEAIVLPRRSDHLRA